ncbi:MAG: hypothetical protein J1G02_01270 [Clostridiales bacterium]|nr:hypothetical protein [Clostridiales bacterium]
MKTRRALQIIVGILSALSLLAILGAAACVALAVLFPSNMPLLQDGYSTLKNGFIWAARYFSIGDMAYLLPLFAYVLPAELFLISAILLFLRDNGKQKKYIAGCILALIGIAISAIFTLMFASDLVVNVTKHAWYHAPIDWAGPDMILRFVTAGSLALFIIFVGAALGVKVKDQAVTAEEQPETDDSQAVVSKETNETVYASSEAQQSPAAIEDTTEPTQEPSISEVRSSVYSDDDNVLPYLDKVKKARWLYDMGAITQEEFIMVVNSYAKD